MFKLEVLIPADDEKLLSKLEDDEKRAHREAECEYPGVTIELNYHPALRWFVTASVGSNQISLDNSVVNVVSQAAS